MNVGDGDFTVTAWINPHELKQGGIVCLGEYNYTHGWYFDMPDNRGILRIETMNADRQLNGVVQSQPGILRTHQWQHVAAVVKRGENQTRLYVNGYQVAVGTIQGANLDNPTKDLHIGRIQASHGFRGEIDDVRLYRRALTESELEAIIEPGRQFDTAPFPDAVFRHAYRLRRPAQRKSDCPETRSRPEPLRSGSTRLRSNRTIGQTFWLCQRNRQDELRRIDEASPLGKYYLAFESRSPRLVSILVCGVTVAVPWHPWENRKSSPAPNSTSSSSRERFRIFLILMSRKTTSIIWQASAKIGVRSEYTDDRDMPRLLIQSIEFEGPFYDSWPPATHRNIFIASEHSQDWPSYAKEIIASFASRASAARLLRRNSVSDEYLAVGLRPVQGEDRRPVP